MKDEAALDEFTENFLRSAQESEVSVGEAAYIATMFLIPALLEIPKEKRQNYINSIIEALAVGVFAHENEPN